MKQLNQSLCDFIETFELEHPTKGICFNAKVYFFTQQLKVQTESEIQIVTIGGKGLDVLYILNPTIDIEGFPDMIVISDADVNFKRKYGLKLKGVSSRWSKYAMVIQPIGKNYTEPVYNKINGNTNN